MKSSISALEYVAGESMTSSNFQPILSRTDRGPNRWTRWLPRLTIMQTCLRTRRYACSAPAF